MIIKKKIKSGKDLFTVKEARLNCIHCLASFINIILAYIISLQIFCLHFVFPKLKNVSGVNNLQAVFRIYISFIC